MKQQRIPPVLLAIGLFCSTVVESKAGMLTFTATGTGESATASFVPETNVTIGGQTYNGILGSPAQLQGQRQL